MKKKLISSLILSLSICFLPQAKALTSVEYGLIAIGIDLIVDKVAPNAVPIVVNKEITLIKEQKPELAKHA